MLDLQAKIEKDPKHIAALFNRIAKRYDKTNALLSFGLNTYWSRRCIHRIAKQKPQNFVDLCGGTGEITRRLSKKVSLDRAVVVDFSAGMLEVGKKIAPAIETIEADVCSVPLAEGAFDCAAMAYGIRNVNDRPAALSEVFRLLQPGGYFIILELTRPANRLLRLGHHLYLKFAVPLMGRLSTDKGSAYTYLSQSIESFIDPSALKKELGKAGFVKVKTTPLTGGIATLIEGSKPL